MLSKRCFCSVLVLILGTLSQPLMGSGPASIQIDRAGVERVRAGIGGRTIIVDWHRTWDYATIQEALNASVDGDTIIVLPSIGSPAGAYVENIIFPARAVTLRSINPGAPAIVAATVIDGNASGRVVTFAEGTPTEAVLEGFTITNGIADGGGGLLLVSSSPKIANNTIIGNSGGDGYGGGLSLWNSSPTIANNTITDNGAWEGGGLYLGESYPTIANNTIAGNSAEYKGGGLYLGESSPTIANNTIAGNSAPSGYGGGLYLGESSPTIANNSITGNSAALGGGLNLNNSSPAIANNTITSNSADGGGGVYLENASSPTITNNTITGNSAAGQGGGLYLGYSSLTIANNIVTFNSSGIYGYDSSGTPTLRYNCVYGNTAYNYANIPDPTGTDGNISADPWLADPQYGNVHIQPGSPCVDAGDNAYVYGDYDMDGQPRIQPVGRTVDIGADESDGTTVWPGGPYGIVRVSTEGDDGHDGSSWALAKRTVQAGIDAAAALGGEVWVQAGTYYERIALSPYAYVYGGFAGSETERDERGRSANATILDGRQQGSVVTARAGYGAVSAIDGFTITNGGGIYCSDTSPTIANNTITGNSGGLYLWNSSATIANNTITGNGAGLYVGGSSPTIANTIIAFNFSGIDNAGSGTPTLKHNCVYGNTAYNYSDIADPTGTDGNISADPRLADPKYGNLHIQPDSPCVDAGDNTYAYGDYDMDGQPRIQPVGGRVDIGADESDGTTVWPGGPYGIVRVSTEGDDAHDGLSWALAKRTVQAGIYAAAALGGEVWVQGGTYGERITLSPYAYVYGGFSGSETARDERDWNANVTALDGEHQGSVVTAQAGYRVSAVDGFTITNGSASGLFLSGGSPTIVNNTITGNNSFSSDGFRSGGGIYVYNSSPTISNNTITGNSASGHDGSGGGIYCSTDSATIVNNTITGNIAASWGGGLYLDYGSSPTIANNAVTGNSAAVGGGLYLFYSSPTVANNTITGNSAALIGGGLYLESSSPTIANTIVAFNSSGIFRYPYQAGTESPTLRYNCVYGNTQYNYAFITDPTGIDGNISADPLFVRPASPGPDGDWGTADDDYGDLRLQSGSPCIDASDNAEVPADAADLDGDGNRTEPMPFDLAGMLRFVDIPAVVDTGSGTPPIVDMGAYESFISAPADLDGDGDVDDHDYHLFESCASGPGVPLAPGCENRDFDGDNDVDMADFAVLQRCYSGANNPSDPGCGH